MIFIYLFSLQSYKQFNEFETRILVSTDFFDLDMDIGSADIIFNYHMPDNPKTFLHRVRYKNLFLFMEIFHFRLVVLIDLVKKV